MSTLQKHHAKQRSSPLRSSGIRGTRSRISQWISQINIPLLIVAALLTLYGLLVVYSAIQGDADYSFTRQLQGVVAGIVLMCVVWRLDYQRLSNYAFPLLIATVILILLPLIPGIGTTVNGARSWIIIFGQRLQPSEFGKPLFILFAAALVGKYQGSLTSGSEYAKTLALLFIPVIVIMAQPDLGTGLVFLVISLVMLFAGGANRRWLIITGVTMVVACILLIVLDGFLDAALHTDVLIKDYQKNRLLVFINPNIDPTGVSYNLRQAMIAIGSGGFFGKGFGNATQSALGFLPEASTDFIFCVLAEQFGFIGSIALIVLYVFLLFIALRISFAANNLYGTLVVAGIIGMWAFQVFENIGMTCGLMPITGIPLPFMSYGSSSMIVNFISLGLLFSVWAHRNIKLVKRG